MKSKLEIIDVYSGEQSILYEGTYHFEAPNWSRDGSFLVFNAGGLMYKISSHGGGPENIPTGFACKCNNDHVLSFDGKELAVSDESQGNGSLIYVLPVGGGTPRQITPVGPSYLHGWSPDSGTLVYCALRNGRYNIFSIPVTGGAEIQLTGTPGHDDGPEFSYGGKFIYFNSDRSGPMQIYRMDPDGNNQDQLTHDVYNNWFPHPSPDGKWVVYLSYDENVRGHPANKNVQLRVMPFHGGDYRVLTSLFGGQGTINVHSWSPDSRKIAFVSYEPD